MCRVTVYSIKSHTKTLARELTFISIFDAHFLHKHLTETYLRQLTCGAELPTTLCKKKKKKIPKNKIILKGSHSFQTMGVD